MLKELKSQHRNIIQMSFNGYSNNEIAERLGMAHTTVSTILRSPLGQAYLHGLQDRAHEATLDVRKKLVSLNKSALDTFEHLLNSSSRKNVPAAVQFNAAKDVLDRNGYKAPDRLNIDMTFQTKTDEELDAEIAAIESAINKIGNGSNNVVSSLKHSPRVENLPEIKDSSKQPSLNNLSSPDLEPILVTTPSGEELSLEDFFEYPELEEPSFIEDPTLLNNLPSDIFKVGKRA